MGGHPDPRPGAEFNGFASEIESDPSGDDLDDGRLCCRVVGEFLPCIEGKHDHAYLVVSVDHSAQCSVDGYLDLSGEVGKYGDWGI